MNTSPRLVRTVVAIALPYASFNMVGPVSYTFLSSLDFLIGRSERRSTGVLAGRALTVNRGLSCLFDISNWTVGLWKSLSRHTGGEDPHRRWSDEVRHRGGDRENRGPNSKRSLRWAEHRSGSELGGGHQWRRIESRRPIG